jgi:hypothetical protein
MCSMNNIELNLEIHVPILDTLFYMNLKLSKTMTSKMPSST